MKQTYLEMTFRKGKPLAAYLYLPRAHGQISTRIEQLEEQVQADYSADGKMIGIEFLSPATMTPADLSRILAEAHLDQATLKELSPLID